MAHNLKSSKKVYSEGLCSILLWYRTQALFQKQTINIFIYSYIFYANTSIYTYLCVCMYAHFLFWLKVTIICNVWILSSPFHSIYFTVLLCDIAFSLNYGDKVFW